MIFFKKKQPVEPEDTCEIQQREGFFSTHRNESLTRAGAVRLRESITATVRGLLSALPKPAATSAMDSTDDISSWKGSLSNPSWGMSDVLFAWYASQTFIGHQACAILAQHWLIAKCCTVPARDAVRNWFEVTSAEGEKLTADELKKIEKLDRKYKLKKNCKELVQFGRVFGVRIVLFKVEYSKDQDKQREAYEAPFNIDAVKAGSYKGISQVDPYWCNPVLDSQDGVQPDSLYFYEPTWWIINGHRVHRSHLIIFINDEVPDMLKPAYLYGGVPLPQRIMERVYAAERCANELPLLATSKRQTVLKTDIAQAMMDKDNFTEVLQEWISYRDNFQVKVCDKDAEDVVQLDTSLTDLDEVVMTSFQVVAAAANIPITKLLGTSPKGFNATGESDEASYREELESIQEHDLTELVNRHHSLLCKSENLGLQIDIEWRPLDSPTAEESANIRATNAKTDESLIATGAIDSYDVRNRLIQDSESGYTWLEVVERPDEIDLEPNTDIGDEEQQDSEKEINTEE